MSLTARLTTLKAQAAALIPPTPLLLTEEQFSAEVLILKERAYELHWESQELQMYPPEWYALENVWDVWAAQHNHNAEAELTYNAALGRYECDGVVLGRTLSEALRNQSIWNV